jgi:hypothetical protein
MRRDLDPDRARPEALVRRTRRALGGSQRLAAWVLSLLALTLGRPTWAQSNGEGDDEAPAASSPARSSLLGRFGIEPPLRLLEDVSADARRRGIERLARAGTPAALQALVDFAYRRGSGVSPREWLTLVRGLAAHVDHAASRQLLASLIVQPSGTRAAPVEDPLRELVREGAALALAHDASAAALAALGQALRAEGASAEAALQALIAHPPPRIEPVLDAPGEPTALVARWLGERAEASAAERLRQLVRSGRASVRAEAALALTRLGDGETPELAERWLRQPQPELRDAALEILVQRRDRRALAPLSEQLRRGPLDDELGRRVLAFADPALEPALLQRVDAPSAPWLWAALGRVGGGRAAARLAQALSTSDGVDAAHALSLMADNAAERALCQSLARDLAPLALRAAVARSYAGGGGSAELGGQLERLESSADPNQRALGAWGRSLFDADAALGALGSGDEARTLAAARNALTFDDELARRMAALMVEAKSERVRVALGAALAHASGRDAVPSHDLLGYAESLPALAPLALRALAERGDARLEHVIERYLNDPDPLLRAHVARGLGDSADPKASGRLITRYELEPNPDVREAIVRALVGRRGRSVQRTLELAATLDASAAVREAARRAARGERRTEPRPERTSYWIELAATVPAVAAESAVLIPIEPGLALPVFPDPDGMLIVAGIREPAGALRFPALGSR